MTVVAYQFNFERLLEQFGRKPRVIQYCCWQWPAGRVPVKKALINVSSTKKYKGGLIGIGASRSFGDVPPNPIILKGK